MVELPPEDERSALLDALIELARLRGSSPLVDWPLRFATPEHFPDHWAPDVDGARSMALRLMDHAQLGHLGAELIEFGGEEPHTFADGMVRQHHGTAAWFKGISNGVCRFGVERSQLTDPEHLVGVMAHEVAHAYRTFHSLVVDDSALEEQLTDLTTIFLGFGVLTTNASERHRSSLQGNVSTWSKRGAGYLSPGTMSFLLAAQSVLRDAPKAERKRITGELERNQASAFKEAVRWLEPRAESLRARLPTPHQESAARASRPAVSAAQQALRAPVQLSMPVFRLKLRGFELGPRLLFGLIMGMLFAMVASSAWPVIAVPVLIFLLERFALPPFCSKCERRLWSHPDSCPKCGGIVVGDIERRRDVHDAEEQYWRSHTPPPGGGGFLN